VVLVLEKRHLDLLEVQDLSVELRGLLLLESGYAFSLLGEHGLLLIWLLLSRLLNLSVSPKRLQVGWLFFFGWRRLLNFVLIFDFFFFLGGLEDLVLHPAGQLHLVYHRLSHFEQFFQKDL